MTVLQSVCSQEHRLRFGDVQQAFGAPDQEREQLLFVRMPHDDVPSEFRDIGRSCSRQLTDWPMAREKRGTVFLPPPEDNVLRRLYWNCVFWC